MTVRRNVVALSGADGEVKIQGIPVNWSRSSKER